MSESLLTLDDVTVRRGSSIVLKNLHLELKQGQFVLLNGANGAGKSTIIEVAAGLLPLESGEVRHHNELLIDASGRLKRPKHAFGLTLQSDGCIGSQRVEEHLLNAMDLTDGRVDVTPWLERYNLLHRRHDLVAHLSGGQRRKVAMLAGILPGFVGEQAKLILLDEPGAGLDEASRAKLVEDLHALRKRGHALLLASHHRDFIVCATDVFNGSEMIPNDVHDSDPLPHHETKTDAVRKHVVVRTSLALNQRTLATVATNGIAGFLTLGILLALVDPAAADSNLIQPSGLFLSAAFAAGLVGDNMISMLHEHRALDWWKAHRQGIPHSYAHGFVLGSGLTALAQLGFDADLSWQLVLIGGLVTIITLAVLRWVDLATSRLARPKAAYTRILTPILILPFALIVQWITDSNLL